MKSIVQFYQRFSTTIALAMGMGMGMATTSYGSTFIVDEGESIQDALDAAAARPGSDRVLLRPGTYSVVGDSLEIEDPDRLTLRGIGHVVIDYDKIDEEDEDEDVEDVIKIRGGDVTLQNLTITGGDDGIDASAGENEEDSLTLINLNVSGNEDEGVEVGDVEDDGVEVDEFDYVEVRDSIFVGNGGDGIFVGTALSVRMSNVRSSGNNDGFDFEVVGTLTMCNVYGDGNSDDGLTGEFIDSVEVRNSSFVGNEGDGIFVGTALSVRMSNVRSSGNNDGFDFEDVETLTLRNVSGDGNFDEGLEGDECGIVTLNHASFTGNLDEGIDIDDTLQIRMNSIHSIGNGGSGFQAEAEIVDIFEITITGSLFANNGEDGIQLRENTIIVDDEEETSLIGDVTLKGVNCRDNDDNGLDIESSGELTLKGVKSGLAQGNGSPDTLPDYLP